MAHVDRKRGGRVLRVLRRIRLGGGLGCWWLWVMRETVDVGPHSELTVKFWCGERSGQRWHRGNLSRGNLVQTKI